MFNMPKGVKIETIGGNCPVQCDGYFITEKGKHRFYFRARGDSVTCDVTKDPAKGDPLSLSEDEVWSWGFRYGQLTGFSAGWISHEFALGCIVEAFHAFRNHSHIPVDAAYSHELVIYKAMMREIERLTKPGSVPNTLAKVALRKP